jgi:hypothetical protein
MKIATAICALVYLLAGGARAESSWQRFTMTIPGGESFSVELPQAPKFQSSKDVAGNTRYNVYIWYVKLDEDRGYIASVAEFPVDVGAAKARRVLEGGLRAGAASTSTGQWASVEWKQHQGQPAFDAAGKTPSGGDLRVYSVMKGTRVFTLNCRGPAGSAGSDDVNRFIASLKIQ